MAEESGWGPDNNGEPRDEEVESLAEELGDEMEEEQAQEVEEEEFDAEQEGKAEAKRILNSVDGETEEERAQNAYDQKQRSLQSLQQDYQQTGQREAQMEQQISGLNRTLDELENADDDQFVGRQMQGGWIIEATGDDLQEGIEDTRETKEELEGRMEEMNTTSALERSIQKDQVALQVLNIHRDMVSED